MPEWSPGNGVSGTATFTYDADPSGVCPGSFPGDQVKAIDNAGNVICATYDSVHRLLSAQVVSRPYSTVTPKIFNVYDAGSVNGVAMTNAAGSLAETYTCSGICASKITDAYFSRSLETAGSVRTGRVVSQLWEATPHSGGYYLTQETAYPNGTLGAISARLGGSSIGVPDLVYGLDGEGRVLTATDNTYSLPLVTTTTYNPAGQLNWVVLGNGDADGRGYDPATNRLSSFQSSIAGSSPFTFMGGLTWNTNGSLQGLALADTNDPGRNQSCAYGMDDLARLSSVDCGAAWAQTFTYGALGNIQKSATAGISYMANYNPLTNQVSSGATAAYDANGNQTLDEGDALSYDAWGHTIAINGVGATYDALGRLAERNGNGLATQYVYGPSGEQVAVIQNGSLARASVPLPGGGTAVYNSTGLQFLRHPDWLGSSRLATTWSHTVYSKASYAPFGEAYQKTGTTDDVFTGKERDAESGLDYFGARYYASNMGRFSSPDPSGLAYADPTNPQSLNLYAYVGNSPLINADPNGLDCIYFNRIGPGPSVYPGACTSPGGTYVDGSIVEIHPTYSAATQGMSYDYTSEQNYSSSFDQQGELIQSVTLAQGSLVAPSNATPANPCAFMGRALPPSAYASAGKAASNNPVTSTLDLAKGFRIGGYLDAQPLASGNVFARAAYGNYAFGVYMASAGFPLSVTLAGADGIAAIHKLSNPNQYSGRQMDSFWGSIPAANVANIAAGYNAQRSGTTCHN